MVRGWDAVESNSSDWSYFSFDCTNYFWTKCLVVVILRIIKLIEDKWRQGLFKDIFLFWSLARKGWMLLLATHTALYCCHLSLWWLTFFNLLLQLVVRPQKLQKLQQQPDFTSIWVPRMIHFFTSREMVTQIQSQMIQSGTINFFYDTS